MTVNAFARATTARRRPRFTVEPAVVAWEAVAFSLRGARDAVVCVPRHALDGFLDELDAGQLDAEIEAFLAAPPTGRVATAVAQIDGPALYDALESPDALAPREREPGRPARFGRGPGEPVDGRRSKRTRRPRPRRLLVGVVTAGVVLAGGIAVAATRGGSSTSTTAAASGPSTTASTTATTAPAATATTIDLARLEGTYTVTQVYSGCGAFDSTINGASLPVAVDRSTGIITIGVSKSTGPLDGTKFVAPTVYPKPNNAGSVTADVIGFFDVSGPIPVLHAQASPDIVGNGTCHITYDGPKTS